MQEEKDQEELYTITCTREQLSIIAHCVEDCSRFASGQTELFNTISLLENYCDARDMMGGLHDVITPELPRGASYGWSGGDCKNKYQKKFIAKTYAIYREILHFITVSKNDPECISVYMSPTLTCEDGGTPPVIQKVERVEKQDK